ncbi:hypothetical protein PAXINDRAFT_169287 [Paxillus involutus ATCC 200175]|uniref:Uncharacterized protein n=1 Tax=Paxillus involutus ATCC 200175 TaxID=664439 RepID=A0A0C9U7G5_PAXIN|nr:hypothetical protein PAXINDRAFT_169287 [Paxillus involutus ATCC 200175]
MGRGVLCAFASAEELGGLAEHPVYIEQLVRLNQTLPPQQKRMVIRNGEPIPGSTH